MNPESEAAFAMLPVDVQVRVREVEAAAQVLIDEAEMSLTVALPDPVTFKVDARAKNPNFLPPPIRAQLISFALRFEHLPTNYSVNVGEKNGQVFITNIAYLRHVLNEFRPLIQNRGDSIHFQKMHSTWRGILIDGVSAPQSLLKVFDEQEREVTALFVEYIGQANRAISRLLPRLEFDYLYNGILQHTDPVFSERFLQDYTSGALNYIIWKHIMLVDYISNLLLPYDVLARGLLRPTPGPL